MQLKRVAPALIVVGLAACQPRGVSTGPTPVAGDSARRIVSAPPGVAPTNRSLQLLVVVTDDWTDVPGVMRRYERDGVRAPWRPVGSEVPVVVGASGLGWGDGLHGIGSPGEPGPIKREGDNRSPAGAFRLSSAFGYAPRSSLSWIEMPYEQATDAYKCVDDPASLHYNQMLFSDRVARIDWHSAEDMHRPDSLYRLGVVVEHNANGQEIGGGSCIFLHIWPGPDGNTSGCTAFNSRAMLEVLAWLRPESLPILVQLPRSEYERLRGRWGLP
jgi:D-alanyl-D-alanine dipeptidase